MDIEANKRVVAEFLDAFSADPVDATTKHLDDAATWWVAGTTPASGEHSKESIIGLMTGLTAGFTGGLRLTPVAFTAGGDRVAAEAESSGELGDGRIYANTYHFLFVVRDGRIAEVREFMDTLHLHSVFFAA